MSIAATTVKEGFSLAFGAAKVDYELYQDFDGQRNSFQDKSLQLYGAQINLGYDQQLTNAYLIGIRSDFLIVDPLKSYNQNSNEGSSSIDGQLYLASGTLRVGRFFNIKTKDIFFREWSYLIGEFFIEAGFGFGRGNLGRNYTFNDGTYSESYEIRVRDRFISKNISLGFNLLDNSGMFIEMKATYITTENNDIELDGNKVFNNIEEDIDLKLQDVESTPLGVFSFLIGHHW